jgi:hypothetical protein
MPGPSFHAILVVDIEGFGRRTNPVQKALRATMYEVVRTAFDEAGLHYDEVVREDRGDGIILLVPGTPTLALAGRFVRALDECLREKAALFAESHRMRMRVALHQGLCEPDDEGWIGEPINTAARLVDADPLKKTLATATSAVMALIVSDEIYRSVIRHDYRLIDAASFTKVLIDAKELQAEPAWIQVPGYANAPGVTDARDTPAAQATAGPPQETPPAAAQYGGNAIHANTVSFGGDMVGGHKYVGGAQ